jgi:2-polyprenyl-6-methoxyphenol hydroxylase-like FAD-dependent oxidoreductase
MVNSGLGAAWGIVDALALATVLEKAMEAARTSNGRSVNELLSAALKVYDSVCRERSQSAVQSSRVAGMTFAWSNPDIGSDTDKIVELVKGRMADASTTAAHALIERVSREWDAALRYGPTAGSNGHALSNL